MDPRIEVIDKRLKNIDRLIAFAGGKGGIGKSTVATITALNLSKKKYKVGILDLDFSGPTTHVILGIKLEGFPQEKDGVIPQNFNGIKFSSIVTYSEDNPTPFRGIDITNAMLEIFAITQWGDLDYLIIDMPPGISDTLMDTIRIINKIEFVIITTESKVTNSVVKKNIELLNRLDIPIVGIIENMKFQKETKCIEQLNIKDIPILSLIPFERNFEKAIGDVERLYNTEFAKTLNNIDYKLEYKK